MPRRSGYVTGMMTAKELGELLIKMGKRKVYVIEDELQDTVLPITRDCISINIDGVYFSPNREIQWQSKEIQVHHIADMRLELKGEQDV